MLGCVLSHKDYCKTNCDGNGGYDPLSPRAECSKLLLNPRLLRQPPLYGCQKISMSLSFVVLDTRQWYLSTVCLECKNNVKHKEPKPLKQYIFNNIMQYIQLWPLCCDAYHMTKFLPYVSTVYCFSQHSCQLWRRKQNPWCFFVTTFRLKHLCFPTWFSDLNFELLACRSSHSLISITLSSSSLSAFWQTSRTQQHTCHYQLLMSFPFARSAVSRVKASEITDSVWQLLCWRIKCQLMPLQCLLKCWQVSAVCVSREWITAVSIDLLCVFVFQTNTLSLT